MASARDQKKNTSDTIIRRILAKEHSHARHAVVLAPHKQSMLSMVDVTRIIPNAKHIKNVNAKLSLFKLPLDIFKMVRDCLDINTANMFNQTCIDANRLFRKHMLDKYKKKQPLLQKLLQYVVNADLDHAEEFIKWHYRFQLVTDEEKMPNSPEEDVIYVEKSDNTLTYSLKTSDGKCSIKDKPITLAELGEAQKSIQAAKADEKDENTKKMDQKIEIPANFIKANLKELRPLILAVTHKSKYTEPKNNRCLLTMKGMVGCDIYLMFDQKDEKNIQNSDANCLRLYRKNNSLVYYINAHHHTFENLASTVEMAKLFDEKDLNKNGVLTNNKLKFSQIEVCKAILAETAKRGHSSYVYSGHRIKGTALQVALGAEDVSRETHPDEGMAEMLMSELKKLPDGAIHIQNQIQAQFDEGWETKEEVRHQKDLAALNKFRKAVTDAKTINDSNLIAAIIEWKEYLEPKGIIENGKHWNARLKYFALQIGWDEWYKDDWRNDLFYNVGIGSIDTHAPTNYAMAQAQGLSYLLQGNDSEKFSRSLKYRTSDNNYFPLSSIPGLRLGVDYWVECFRGCGTPRGANDAWRYGHPFRYLLRGTLENLYRVKTEALQKFMLRSSRQSKACCTIM